MVMKVPEFYSLQTAITKTAIAINAFGDEIVWEDRRGRQSRIMNSVNIAQMLAKRLPDDHADSKFDVRIFICTEKRYL